MKCNWIEFENELNDICKEHDLSKKDFTRISIERILGFRLFDDYGLSVYDENGCVVHLNKGSEYSDILFGLLNTLGKGLKEILILGRLKGVL